MMLSQHVLKSKFKYDNGYLMRISGNPTSDSLNSAGYKRVSIDGTSYLTHRVIFMIVHGFVPEQIDHIDRDKTNNNISNLRPTTNQLNAINCKLPSNNSSGKSGVHWCSRALRWIAKIHIDKEGHRCARGFKDLDIAIQYRRKLELEHYGRLCPH